MDSQRIRDIDMAEVASQVREKVGEATHEAIQYRVEFGTMPLHLMTLDSVMIEIARRCREEHGSDKMVSITHTYDDGGIDCIVNVNRKVVAYARNGYLPGLSAAHGALDKLRKASAGENTTGGRD